MPPATVWRIMRKCLIMKPYKLQLVQAITAEDKLQLVQAITAEDK